MAHNLHILLAAAFYLIIMNPKILAQGQEVPCLFFFGDSVFDNGNNNVLRTKFKANYLPYGVDYPVGPTGRFSNGMNKADFLSQLLGFNKSIPPFVYARGLELFKGVNYASGGSGIRDETGIHLGDRFTFNGQLYNHNITRSRIASMLRDPRSVDSYLNKCMYVVYIGGDDYINNYFLPESYPTSSFFTPEKFASSLIQQFTGQLKTLYYSGARNVAVFGLGLLGCLPQETALFPPNGSTCVDSINVAVQLFNVQLRPLVDYLNKDLRGAKFIYINTTGIDVSNILGYNVTNAPCCRVSLDGLCIPNKVPCRERTNDLFYDGLHPVEVFDQAISARAYKAQLPSEAYPFDIQHLALKCKFQNNITLSQIVGARNESDGMKWSI